MSTIPKESVLRSMSVEQIVDGIVNVQPMARSAGKAFSLTAFSANGFSMNGASPKTQQGLTSDELGVAS